MKIQRSAYQTARFDRKIHIEMLRLIAVYLVLFNHTESYGYLRWQQAKDSVWYPFYLIMSIITAVNVPTFFMISGALLLKKEETYKDLYRKRVCKFLAVLLVTTLVYFAYDCKYNASEMTVRSVLVFMYHTPYTAALWYLYSYLAALIMLPFLRKLAAGMKAADYYYLVICHLFFLTIIPIIQFICSNGTVAISTYLTIPFASASNIFFLLMGHYFEQVMDEEKYTLRNVLIVNALGFFSIAAAYSMIQYKEYLTDILGKAPNGSLGYFSALPTFALYFTMKYLFLKHPVNESVKKIICTAGGTTFGIYLVERILRERLIWVYVKLSEYLPIFPACLLWIFCVLIVGGGIVYLFKKIPGVGRVI